MKNSLLISLHCEDDAGYAIDKLVSTFQSSANLAGYAESNIIVSYSTINTANEALIKIDHKDKRDTASLLDTIKTYNVDKIIAFDLQYPSYIASVARKAGVKKIISYWGASISSIQRMPKLLIKRLLWYVQKNAAADLFVFESDAMRLTATHGRGIPKNNTKVIYLGADLETYKPNPEREVFPEEIEIPRERKVVFYSGHMEERKGVAVIMQAANYLAEQDKITNLHFLLCGNRAAEADKFIQMLSDKAKQHVTFAGYRSDIPHLMQNCHMGVIASTGWDSFTRSSVEMLASGLPLIVSDLGGLPESTVHNETGFHFPAGDYIKLAGFISVLNDDDSLRRSFSHAARKRAESNFSESSQRTKIAHLLN